MADDLPDGRVVEPGAHTLPLLRMARKMRPLEVLKNIQFCGVEFGKVGIGRGIRHSSSSLKTARRPKGRPDPTEPNPHLD